MKGGTKLIILVLLVLPLFLFSQGGNLYKYDFTLIEDSLRSKVKKIDTNQVEGKIECLVIDRNSAPVKNLTFHMKVNESTFETVTNEFGRFEVNSIGGRFIIQAFPDEYEPVFYADSANLKQGIKVTFCLYPRQTWKTFHIQSRKKLSAFEIDTIKACLRRNLFCPACCGSEVITIERDL